MMSNMEIFEKTIKCIEEEEKKEREDVISQGMRALLSMIDSCRERIDYEAGYMEELKKQLELLKAGKVDYDKTRRQIKIAITSTETLYVNLDRHLTPKQLISKPYDIETRIIRNDER